MANVTITAFFLWFGLREFRKTETRFADFV